MSKLAPLPRMAPEELREIRSRLGLTQVEMAERLGTHPTGYQKWERGATRMLGSAVILARKLLCDHENVNNISSNWA